MKSKSDFLAIAARNILRPALAEYGFQEYAKKHYFRLCGNIAQFLDLQKSSWGGGDFAVNYSVFLLAPPRKFIGSIFGGRLPRGKSSDGWWKSSKPEFAEASIHEVVSTFRSFTWPIFQQTSTLEGYIAALKGRGEHLSPHIPAEIGCALILNNQINQALPYIERAEREYRDFASSVEKVDWSLQAADRMAHLREAMKAGSQGELLNAWIRESVVKLKLDTKWVGG